MSSGGVGLSESLVKARSRSFDLQAIFSLNLSCANLRQLHPCLQQCADLWQLDLSSNLLPSAALSLLDAARMPKLTHLSLASNRIDSLASLPGPMLKLHTLRLEGNELRDIQGAGGIALLRERCPNLRVLSLRTLKGDKTNPVCSLPSYRADVLALLPSLRVLDGERTGAPAPASSSPFAHDSAGSAAAAAFYKEYAALEAATAAYATGVPPPDDPSRHAKAAVRPVEDWFPNESWPAIQPAELDADLQPRAAVVRASLKECARILQEECDKSLAAMEAKYGCARGDQSRVLSPQEPDLRNNGAASNFGFADGEE